MPRGATAVQQYAEEYQDAGLNLGGSNQTVAVNDLDSVFGTNGLDVTKGGFDALPNGSYPATLIKTEVKMTKNNVPRLAWTFQIDGDGEYNGRKVMDGTNLQENTMGFVARNARAAAGAKWMEFMRESGKRKQAGDPVKPSELVAWIAEHCVGGSVRIELGPPQNEQSTFNTVKSVLPAA